MKKTNLETSSKIKIKNISTYIDTIIQVQSSWVKENQKKPISNKLNFLYTSTIF